MEHTTQQRVPAKLVSLSPSCLCRQIVVAGRIVRVLTIRAIAVRRVRSTDLLGEDGSQDAHCL